VLRATTISTLLIALALTPSALAQGGVPAPDFSEPCPALYPGDDAPRERIARWMARGAADRGLPHELPVMAGIAESGLRNLRGESYHGFFGMHESLPRRPELQLGWFLDTAELVRRRRVAEGRPDPAQDPADYGLWIADVERPAAENRGLYQQHLEEARELVAGRCAPPAATDSTPPRLRLRIAARQGTGSVTGRTSCDEDCLVGIAIAFTVAGRERTRSYAAGASGAFTLPLPRAVRRALAGGRALRVRVTATAADTAANAATRSRTVRLLP
jgi:hypothetical protein